MDGRMAALARHMEHVGRLGRWQHTAKRSTRMQGTAKEASSMVWCGLWAVARRGGGVPPYAYCLATATNQGFALNRWACVITMIVHPRYTLGVCTCCSQSMYSRSCENKQGRHSSFIVAGRESLQMMIL